jgi:hypothetical protein
MMRSGAPLLNAVDLLKTKKADNRQGDGRKRRRSDHQIVRPRCHSIIPAAMSWVERARAIHHFNCRGKTKRAKDRWLKSRLRSPIP